MEVPFDGEAVVFYSDNGNRFVAALVRFAMLLCQVVDSFPLIPRFFTSFRVDSWRISQLGPAKSQRARFVFLKQEFDTIGYGLFEAWDRRKIDYIQVLKEWNEFVGYNDIYGAASKILDMDATLKAFRELRKLMTDEEGFLERLRHNIDDLCPDLEEITKFIEFLENQIDSMSDTYIVESALGDELTDENQLTLKDQPKNGHQKNGTL